MELQFFNQQIDRLKNQWANAYGNERKGLIWTLVNKMPNEFMLDAVNYFLAYSRQAPLGAEFEKEMARHQERFATRRSGDCAGFAGVMQEALDKRELDGSVSEASKDFARACVKVVTDKCSGKMSGKAFWDEALPFIEQVGGQLRRPKK